MKQAWGWAGLIFVACWAAGPARAAEWFVATNGNDAAAGTNWATAKLTIQAAIDAAVSNDTVWVSNGVYATGGRVVYGAMTNRVVIDKPITVRSTNGPAVTVIQGAWHPGTTNGDTAVRCVYVGLNATLIGFTLTNGATHEIGDVGREMAGGGAYCETSSVLTNCIVTGNSAHYFGGGVFRGVLYNCTISRNMNNQERGGGTCESTLYNCTLIGNSATAGGGAALGSLYNCTLVGNLATNGLGGGAYYATLNGCTLASNSAYYSGGVYNCTLTNCVLIANSGVGCGGAWGSTLNNCTLVGNSATNGSGGGCSSYSTLNDCTLSGNSASHGGGASHSTLNRCVLTSNTAIRSGGGAIGGTLNNCIIIGNKSSSGGGACDSTLNNCAIAGNSADTEGGGSFWGTLNNCTIVSNSAPLGGGTYGGTLNNCIVYYNTGILILPSKARGNHEGSTFNYCCTTPDPGGTGNITNDPQFVDAAAGNYRLQSNSPCINRGNNDLLQGTTDLDGNPRILNGVVDMGAYEYIPATWYVATNGNDSAAGTNWATAKATIQAAIDSAFSNDTVWVSNGVYATGMRTINGSNRVAIVFPVIVQSVNGPEVTIIQGARDPASTNGWGAAAVRCAYVGSNATLSGFTLTNGATLDFGGGAWCETAGVLTNCVIVGNSTYSGGGGVYQGLLYDCILSGNKTWHMGGGARASTLNRCTLTGNSAGAGGGSVDCTLIDCLLVGNMATDGDGGGSNYDVLNRCTLASNSASGYGGGSYDSTLSNCVLVGNSAGGSGGGSFYCNLYNCTVASNRATYYGGGAYGITLNDCKVVGNVASNGGGAYSCTLNKCPLIGNSASDWGGGAYVCTLNNCIVIRNTAAKSGGGSCDSTLNNCTIVSNSAPLGGGTYGGTLNNCIVYYNTGILILPSKARGNHEGSTFNYCCTTPDPGGIGNITLEPQFVDAAAGNYRLQSNSPCINRGNNDLVQGDADLDGNPRIAYGTVDMGAYEAQFPVGYWAWAAAIANGMTNEMDCAAGDGMPNLLRYVAGGHPTEADGLARLDLAFDSGLPTLLFNRNTNATDVTLVIQGADEMSDGAAWRDLATNINGSWGGVANVSESGPGNPVACAVQDPVPLITNRFLRLKVTRP